MTTVDTDRALLSCRGICKRFGGEVALAGVDFDLRAGEVHGVVGSNGAGKSTLMRILAGALPDHDGEVTLGGERLDLSSPQAALSSGVAMVYQELSGVGQLSVAENLFLGRQPTTRWGRIDWRAMQERASAYLAELEIRVDVRRRLDAFPLVVRQMVEIARGLHSGARVLILDEPTSALSPPETRRLFELVEELKRRGVAVVFISHFIEDVLAICDRVTVLRDGQKVATRSVSAFDKHGVIQAMLGHAVDEPEAGYETAVRLPEARERETVVTVDGLSVSGEFEDVSFSIGAGECLGIYGYVGAGHQTVAHAVAGAVRTARGTVRLGGGGGDAVPNNVHKCVRRGVVLVAADRASTVVHGAEVYKNVTLGHLKERVGGWLSRRRETAVARPLLAQVGCRPAEPMMKAGQLSGGNQQKTVLAKWLAGRMRVLVLDEPTRGMDVGAKEEIMRIVREQREAGTAVLLVSTEPELLLAHADRILVMRRGRVTHEFADETLDKATLLRYA